MEFASGQFTTIDEGSLSLFGAYAFVADASDTNSNSALTGLTGIYCNSLNLYDGASVTTSGALTDSGSAALPSAIVLDQASGDGGSSLTVGGTLTNGGTIQIGPLNLTLSANSTINAPSLSNFTSASYFGGALSGTIDLCGSSTAEATLNVGSAAGFGTAETLDGNVGLYGSDALIEFASGQITTIAGGADLLLFGPHAFVADASDTGSNSALAGLTTVQGLLVLHNGAR